MADPVPPLPRFQRQMWPRTALSSCLTLPITLDAEHAEPSTSSSSSSERQTLLEALGQPHVALSQSRFENNDLKEQLDPSKGHVQHQSVQIAMLLGKVEKTSRDFMRLQTENYRQSQLQLASIQDGVGLNGLPLSSRRLLVCLEALRLEKKSIGEYPGEIIFSA